MVSSVGLEGNAYLIACLLLGIGLTFVCLFQITRNMRVVIAGNIERGMNRVLETSGFIPLAIGIAMTVAVQSSSITTSLMVPMCAAGVLSLRKAFPVMLGANIGTTVTALLASIAQDSIGALTIALVHLLFNVAGVVLVYLIPPLREVPIRLAQALAARAAVSIFWVVAYVGGVFVLLPLIGWLIWGKSG